MTNPDYPADESEFDAHIQRECKRIQADWEEAECRRRAGLGGEAAVELQGVIMGVIDGRRAGR